MDHSTETAADREQTVNDAVNVIRRDYYGEVRGIATDAIDHLRAAYNDDGQRGEELRENLLEWMHQTIDGTQRVIYTFRAQLGLLVSDNAGAYVEDCGAEGATMGDDLNWSALMFSALERDVYEQLDAEGLDVNDPEAFFRGDEDEGEDCECADPGCECNGRCDNDGTHRLYRIDMDDISGTLMCSRCADDAMESGVFSDEPVENEEVGQ